MPDDSAPAHTIPLVKRDVQARVVRVPTRGTGLARNHQVPNVGGRVTILGTDLSDSSRVWAPARLKSRDAARKRLAGTIWGRSEAASAVYGAFFAFGVGLGRIGISANALTYWSLVFAGLSCAAAATGFFAVAALLVVVGGICDALDGVVARSTGTVSQWGALLDSTVDRVTDALPLFGVLLFYAHDPALVLAPGFAIVGSFVIPYVRARAESLGRTLPPLFMRRPERVVLLVVCLLLGEANVPAQIQAPLLLLGVMVLAVLNLLGAIVVLRAARAALGGAGKSSSASPPAAGSAAPHETAAVGRF